MLFSLPCPAFAAEVCVILRANPPRAAQRRDSASEGSVRAEHDLSCKNKPTRLASGSLPCGLSDRKKQSLLFQPPVFCEQDLLLCFPCGLFTHPGSAGSSSSQGHIELGGLGVRSPVPQLADGTQDVFVGAKGNRGNHGHGER